MKKVVNFIGKGFIFVLQKTNVIAYRPAGYIPPVFVEKKETHPQRIRVAKTTMPNNKSFDEWYNDGWSKEINYNKVW